MRTLRDIQADIGALSDHERTALLDWLLEADRKLWDEQICADFSTGGAGMTMLDDIDHQIRKGSFRPME